ncbi:MAG: hypothetical protein FJ143_15490 [Deltaproteobacteria bacterium]|nr:hypothetical protein [Deltaproteobacteria bacterium]
MNQPSCPSCLRQFVRRVAIVGAWDTLLGLCYIYPFKCQICGFRFRMPQWGVRYVKVPEDQREYDRMAARFALTFTSQNISGRGTATNLSMGGCNFDTATPLATGMVLRMELQIAADVAPVVVDAAAVRYARDRSVGVEFLQWQEKERERLQLYVRGLLISRPG